MQKLTQLKYIKNITSVEWIVYTRVICYHGYRVYQSSMMLSWSSFLILEFVNMYQSECMARDAVSGMAD